MRPTEVLKEEHQGIKVGLRILGRIADKLQVGESVPPEHMEQMVDFIRTFADRCHHGKEEDLLFGEMEKAGVPKEGGPIAVMLAEHDQGRSYVRAMADALPAYKAGDPAAARRFAQNASNYIGLLTQHIDKEDNILYVIADMHLSDEQQACLLEGFDRVEMERIGPGKHEEYHHMLDRLSGIYLQ
ncbi:MAG: hemerythrin domain-containing protein [Chloroflexi bacterium]|nr:hemerythrin domain-containing protein [Chloroflexota bacterium]